MFLSALQAETETALHDAMKLCEFKGREEAPKARIGTLKEDLQAGKQQRSPSPAVANESESERENDGNEEPCS